MWNATCHTNNFCRLCEMRHVTQAISGDCVAEARLHKQFQKTVWQATFYIVSFSRLCGRRRVTQAISIDCVAGDIPHRQFQKTVQQRLGYTGSFRRLCIFRINSGKYHLQPGILSVILDRRQGISPGNNNITYKYV